MGRVWSLIFVQVAFFGVIFSHAATSFSKALITIGVLSARQKQKKLDWIIYVVCAVLFLVTSAAVVRGELAMFLH